MNQSIKGTQTEKYLAKSYAIESTAYSRYIFFAKSARKESYFQFAEIFEETAENEFQHAQTFLEYLKEGSVVADPISVEAGILTPTLQNLKVASHEEDIEGVQTYTEAAEVAKKEGFAEIAARFRIIAGVENRHKARFDYMASLIENDSVWKRDEPIRWQCMDCGYVFEGKTPPVKCPGCGHPTERFMAVEDKLL